MPISVTYGIHVKIEPGHADARDAERNHEQPKRLVCSARHESIDMSRAVAEIMARFFAERVPHPSSGDKAPSGRRPMSSGERRTIKSAGPTTKTNVTIRKPPRFGASQAKHQRAATPACDFAKPTPILVIASARPRWRTNQCAMTTLTTI